jgi:hypothetical protein
MTNARGPPVITPVALLGAAAVGAVAAVAAWPVGGGEAGGGLGRVLSRMLSAVARSLAAPLLIASISSVVPSCRTVLADLMAVSGTPEALATSAMDGSLLPETTGSF